MEIINTLAQYLAACPSYLEMPVKKGQESGDVSPVSLVPLADNKAWGFESIYHRPYFVNIFLYIFLSRMYIKDMFWLLRLYGMVYVKTNSYWALGGFFRGYCQLGAKSI